MSDKTENLSLEDVISFTEDEEYSICLSVIKSRFSISKTFEFNEFKKGISRLINLSDEFLKTFEEGIPCRVMTTQQQGWRLGKIRLKIELQFIPDESLTDQSIDDFDNPLDEIRKISGL